jgi:aspartate kinase
MPKELKRIRRFTKVGYEDVLLVVSAMGKTTNALEVVIKDYFDKSAALQSSVQEIKKYHNQILMDLFEDENHAVFAAIKSQFSDLEYFLSHNKSQTTTLYTIK